MQIAPFLPRLIPRASAALATLEFSQRKLRAANGGELSAAGGYLSGCMSGVTEGIVFSPFQVMTYIVQNVMLVSDCNGRVSHSRQNVLG